MMTRDKLIKQKTISMWFPNSIYGEIRENKMSAIVKYWKLAIQFTQIDITLTFIGQCLHMIFVVNYLKWNVSKP